MNNATDRQAPREGVPAQNEPKAPAEQVYYALGPIGTVEQWLGLETRDRIACRGIEAFGGWHEPLWNPMGRAIPGVRTDWLRRR